MSELRNAIHSENLAEVKRLLADPQTIVGEDEVRELRGMGYVPKNHIGRLEKQIEIIKEVLKRPNLQKFIINELPGFDNEEKVVELLKYPGIDVNAQDSIGRTPLYLGITYHKYTVVRALLADPRVRTDIPSRSGRLPFSLKTSPATARVIEEYKQKQKMMRSVSEVALMSGTDNQPVSNAAPVQPKPLPQLPPDAVGKIAKFLDIKPRVKTEAEKARDKEILKQLHPPPPPSNNGGRKTRRNPISTRKSTMRKNHNIY